MLKFKVIDTGFCTQNEKNLAKTCKNKTIKIPANVILIKHEKLGYMLYDTGYSPRFYEATRKFPYNLYSLITKVTCNTNNSIVEQLKNNNIDPNEIKYIFISHFHGDHICGLKDFPNATFMCFKTAYQEVSNKKCFAALKRGFLPDLIPDDFEQRTEYIDNKKLININIFDNGYDIFNDGSLIAIDLSGHANGQMGLLLDSQTLLIADACWHKKNYTELELPPNIILNILGNKSQYINTVKKIQRAYKEKNLKIILSHCYYGE